MSWTVILADVVLDAEPTPGLVFRPTVHAGEDVIDDQAYMLQVAMRTLKDAGWTPYDVRQVNGVRAMSAVPASSRVEVDGCVITVTTPLDRCVTQVDKKWLERARTRGGFMVVLTCAELPERLAPRFYRPTFRVLKKAYQTTRELVEPPVSNPGSVAAFVSVQAAPRPS